MRLIAGLELCLLLPFAGQVLARPGPASGPAGLPHSLSRPSRRAAAADDNNGNRKGSDGGACGKKSEVTISAPKRNIFQTLTDEEYVEATAFLHAQEELNLTAVVNSTA